MLLKLDHEKGTLTFRTPKLYKKLEDLLNSMGPRAVKRGKFCTKEKLVRGEPQEVKSASIDVRKVRTPMALDHRDIYEPASTEDGNALVPYDEFDSRKLLGLAAWIILHVRPDASHVAAIVARFTGSKQTEAVIKHVVRLCWYLIDTQDECVLTYHRGHGEPKITCMVDASFANDPITKKSYFGYVIRFGKNPVAWRSKLETSVALSTRDAEMMAAVSAVRHVLGLRFFLSEMKVLSMGASSVMIDNTASMDGVKNDKNSKHSHYMGYKMAWLREQVADLLVTFEYVRSNENTADIFTKVLPEDQYIGLRNQLLGLMDELD